MSTAITAAFLSAILAMCYAYPDEYPFIAYIVSGGICGVFGHLYEHLFKERV